MRATGCCRICSQRQGQLFSRMQDSQLHLFANSQGLKPDELLSDGSDASHEEDSDAVDSNHDLENDEDGGKR